jgi:hypothetical protein
MMIRAGVGWGNDVEKESVAKRKASLSTAAGAQSVERWAVNKAVHYNEGANCGKKDFEPVVAAFMELLRCFKYDTCESWPQVTPRGNARIFALRLQCDQSQPKAKVGQWSLPWETGFTQCEFTAIVRLMCS